MVPPSPAGPGGGRAWFGLLVPPSRIWPHIANAAATETNGSGIWYPRVVELRERRGMLTSSKCLWIERSYPRVLGTPGSGNRYPGVRADGTRSIRAFGTPLNR